MTDQRFHGQIAGVGTSSGVRIVVGRWRDTPWGPFADAMVELADGHRLLLAPTPRVRDFIAGTYTFDETRVESVEMTVGTADASGHEQWRLRTDSLTLDLEVGRRTALGWALRLVPRRLSASPAVAVAVDPVARVVLRGVRTAGTARAGRREYYGAGDAHAVVAATGSLQGRDLGTLAPVDPPCRFGFSSTPRRPSVTDVVTTVRDL